MDLEMMTNFNAKERDLDDWRSLFTRSDPKLMMVKVSRPSGRVNSGTEAALEEVEEVIHK
jgi:predicted secreted hydrolase